jgi:hypothetical protein
MVILIGTGNATDDIDDIGMVNEKEKGMMNDVVSAEGGIITTTRLKRRGKNDEKDDVSGKSDIGIGMAMEGPIGIGLETLIDRIIVRGSPGPREDPGNPGLNEAAVEREMTVIALRIVK